MNKTMNKTLFDLLPKQPEKPQVALSPAFELTPEERHRRFIEACRALGEEMRRSANESTDPYLKRIRMALADYFENGGPTPIDFKKAGIFCEQIASIHEDWGNASNCREGALGYEDCQRERKYRIGQAAYWRKRAAVFYAKHEKQEGKECS